MELDHCVGQTGGDSVCEDASTQSSALHPDNKIIHGQRKPQCIHYAKMPPCGFMTPSRASFPQLLPGAQIICIVEVRLCMLVVIDEGFKRHLGKKAECPICFNEKCLVPVCEWGHLVCEDCGPNLNMQKYPAHFVVVPLSRR